MPTYQLQSALGAGLADAAGFMAGQTDKKRYQAEQQRQAQIDANAQADTAARLGLERSNQEATNASRRVTQEQGAERLKIERENAARAQGEADARAAADAAAAQKQKLIETFQGQGLKYPKNWATMKPEEKIGYLQVRLNAAQKAGDTKTVSNTETEINRVATEAAAQRRQDDLERQRDTQNQNTAQRIQIQLDRPPAERVPRNAQGLTPEEVIQNAHWEQEHPKSKPAKTTTPEARNKDYTDAANAIKRGADRDAVVKRYAAKWNLDPTKVDGLFP